MSTTSFVFKVACEPWELEQICRLNYKTFVEEIPQHAPNQEQILVDKFHHENTYLICTCNQQVVGMLAARDNRPFSLDGKLDNLDAYLPPHHSAVEIRLLAVEKEHRSPRVFQGLMLLLAQYVEAYGYDLVVISGTVRQLRLYRHLGFKPFGPLVGAQEAQFQPMYLTLDAIEVLRRGSKAFSSSESVPAPMAEQLNLLPGPVAINNPVRKTHDELPVSHRSHAFMERFAQTKRLLCQLVGAQFVEILAGSGTLANDVVAGQLSLLHLPGLILTNGEFGDRLIDHATRFKLKFRHIHADWGSSFEPTVLKRAAEEDGDARWLWAVHCETSSGILNDLAFLKGLSAQRNLLLCLDCTSSVGNVAVDLSDVYLASSTSGKGLRAYPGLSFVFYNHPISPAPTELPRYLDLGLYASCSGVPFTISSNLVYPLHTALAQFRPERFDKIANLSARLRAKLIASGFQIVGSEMHTMPGVVTVALPQGTRSEDVGDQLQQAGYLVSYRSEYLLRRNWIQFCLMGEYNKNSLGHFVDIFLGIVAKTALKYDKVYYSGSALFNN